MPAYVSGYIIKFLFCHPVAVPDVPGYGSRMHTHDHGGSEAHDEPPDSILSISRPAASPWRPAVICESYHPEHPLVKHTSPVYHAHGAQQQQQAIVLDLLSIYGADKPIIYLRPPVGLAVELSSTSYLEPRVDKHNLLRGSCSDSRISSLWSNSGVYRDGGNGGSGGDGHPDDGSNGDGTGGGDESASGAVHLARRSPVEGGDSEICGEWLMCRHGLRSLQPSASGGRDNECLKPDRDLSSSGVMSVEGGGITGSVPLGGETCSTVGTTTTESAGAKCSSSSSSSSSSVSSPDESPSSSSPSYPTVHG
ncbi:hypothetical protein Tco_0348236 [Tanacetum coccineum]